MRIASFIGQTLVGAPRPVAGLDISDTHARWILFESRARHGQPLQWHEWPLQPGWVDSGRVIEFTALAEAIEQWVAGTGVHRVTMALPPEACTSAVIEQPKGLRPWHRRRWLARQAAQLLGRRPIDISWSAHALADRPRCWRLMCTPLEWVQDWRGLAEAAGCELVCLDEAHQAGWRALDRWYRDAPEGMMALQIGAACVQALQFVSGRWQWAWRTQAPVDDVIAQCLATVDPVLEICLLGHSPLATALHEGLQRAGLTVSQPSPGIGRAWAAGQPWSDLSDAFWPALGLAGGAGPS